MPLQFFLISSSLCCNSEKVWGGEIITGTPGCQLAGVEASAQSEICKASTVRIISGINRPIFKG